MPILIGLGAIQPNVFEHISGFKHIDIVLELLKHEFAECRLQRLLELFNDNVLDSIYTGRREQLQRIRLIQLIDNEPKEAEALTSSRPSSPGRIRHRSSSGSGDKRRQRDDAIGHGYNHNRRLSDIAAA